MFLREAVIAVTYRCNSRCEMCNIWRIEDHKEMHPREYRKLPSTLHTINITGGEPFMRSDLEDVVWAVHTACPESRMVFSSNGFMTKKIVDMLSRISEFHPRLGVGISVDGLEDTHDKIRGVKGMYNRAIETVMELKSLGMDDLRLAMTFIPDNLPEAQAVYALAEDLEVEFTATVAHNSDIYFRKTENPGINTLSNVAESVMPIVHSQLKSKSIKDWYRAYHMAGLYSRSIRRRFATKCQAGRRYVFIAPDGDVYPCNVLEKRIGNLAEVRTWNELMDKGRMSEVLESVRLCRRDCWMVCNTRSLILSHPFQASYWVARQKLRAHDD